MSALLFRGASEVVTCESTAETSVLRGVAVVVEGGRIAAVGPESELVARHPAAETVDCAGGVLTPGLIDSHTHAVFGRWRADEYMLRCRGMSYMEIARRGGGINASVRDLRERSEDELVELTRVRLAEMLSLGTTTAEVKSGYGLRTEDELKMLRVIRRLGEEGPMDLVPTFLGAHEVPPEYRDRRDRYVELVIHEMIPAVAEGGLAVFCDVFMEPGVFSGEEARRILEAGLEHGLIPKLHADELEPSGGAELAVELGAASADHLGRVSDEGIRALAGSDTVATLLPATLFFLGKRDYAPARRLIDAGATVALATDFNPGSAPGSGLPLVMTMACSQMGMEPLEALVAATAGGARALRLEDGRGTLRVGAPADLVLWGVDDHRQIPYRFGAPLVRGVWKRGERVR
ncbi:MAG TPA: imidazolonepropionase [Longimicrobiales bacterium]|nr:imidazolonepropionase [Longimicrobiales bacterium]